MLRLYPLIVFLQLFCLYHVYTNKTEQKWYWIIIIFPFIGSAFYLYHAFYNRRNVDNLAEGVKSSFNSDYKLNKLEKQANFTETLTNKLELADEYAKRGEYTKALTIYKSSLAGTYQDDPNILRKILSCSYLVEDYNTVIECGLQLDEDPTFKNAEEKVAFAWSYYHLDDFPSAETYFKEMDVRFSNYTQRMEYAYFLSLIERKEEAKEKLTELLEELDSMDRYEQRLKKQIHKEIKSLYSQIN